MSAVRDRQNINTEVGKKYVKKRAYFTDDRQLFHSVLH